MMSTLLLAIAASLAASTQAPPESPGGLRRGAFFGAAVAPLPEDLRGRLKLEAGQGARVDGVIPGSTAEAIGLVPGDVIVAIDGANVEGSAGVVRAIASRKGGDPATIDYRRGDESLRREVTLRMRPLERSDAHEVEYGSIVAQAGRLRTIVTRPKGAAGKHPALMLIQGIGTGSVEGPRGGYREIIDDFTARGFVTLRVDKPGCGDSEGGPSDAVDFDTELDGYRQALKMLRDRPDVDPANVFVFGHSMGGVMAPLLGPEVPVRGIIAYGTIGRTWAEYIPENFRRQAELAGMPRRGHRPPGQGRRDPDDPALRRPPDPKEVAEKYPDLARAGRAVVPRRPDPRRPEHGVLRASSPPRTWAGPGRRSRATPWRSGAAPTSSRTRTTTPSSPGSSTGPTPAVGPSWPSTASTTASSRRPSPGEHDQARPARRVQPEPPRSLPRLGREGHRPPPRLTDSTASGPIA